MIKSSISVWQKRNNRKNRKHGLVGHFCPPRPTTKKRDAAVEMRYWALKYHLSLFFLNYRCNLLPPPSPAPQAQPPRPPDTVLWTLWQQMQCTVAISLTYHTKEKATGCQRDDMKEPQPYWLFIEEKNSIVTVEGQRFSMTGMKNTISHEA